MANEQRIPRTQDAREVDVIHEEYTDNWEPASMLSTKDIPARPGYVQRWVRTSLKGVDDHSNVFAKIAQRWQPRPASSIPKGVFIPTVKFQDADIIGFHGMILMERPEELHKRHAQHNKQQALNLVRAEESSLYKVHDGSAKRYVTKPEFTHDSSVSRGRVPDIDD